MATSRSAAAAPLEVACAGVLFDLDGVLVDSLPAVERVWGAWARERGLDPDRVVAMAHGHPSLDTIRALLPGADAVALNREIERRESADTGGIVPLPGAREQLQALPPERWAIVTACTRPLAEARIRAAGLPWPAQLVTSDDGARSKPAPDPYQLGAARLGLAPQACLVVEDRQPGVVAGKAAGARVLGLTTSLTAQQLLAAGADWIASDCRGFRARLP